MESSRATLRYRSYAGIPLDNNAVALVAKSTPASPGIAWGGGSVRRVTVDSAKHVIMRTCVYCCKCSVHLAYVPRNNGSRSTRVHSGTLRKRASPNRTSGILRAVSCRCAKFATSPTHDEALVCVRACRTYWDLREKYDAASLKAVSKSRGFWQNRALAPPVGLKKIVCRRASDFGANTFAVGHKLGFLESSSSPGYEWQKRRRLTWRP